MSRYIDADKIEYEDMLYPRGDGNYEECQIAYRDQIDDIPTADVVEVVRCKDCRWWDNEDDAERCTHKYGDMWAKPDGYCSYGERHESNETGETDSHGMIVCSVCGHVPKVGWRSNFCPNCGFVDTFRRKE